MPGRIYADTACASCHAVAPGQLRSPDPKAPTFEMIANVPGMTLMALNVVLHTSHKTMPNLIIESGRIEDLSAYLFTLKR
jgi:mono/diheme cytochrome c family protein